MSKASLFLSGIGNDICSPFFNLEGKLHAILQNNGEIIAIDSTTGQIETIHSTGGQPSGAIYDPNDGTLYITDYAHNSVLSLQKGTQQESIVAVYEDKPLKGPSSIISINGSLYFTDSGPFGETNLQTSTGSLFVISSSPSNGQILKPISLNNLANPSAIASSNDGQFM